MSNITKCDKRQSGLFLFQRRLDNKYTIKRESKTTGGDQVKNEQQSDRGHDRRTRYGNDDVRCYMIYNEKKVEMVLSISLDTFYSNKNYAARKI